MLVLSRRLTADQPEEAEVVLTLPDGREVTVAVLEVDRKKVRLGITAPRDVVIARRELMPFPRKGD